MYIMKKMNREKKASNESERDALIQKGYQLVCEDNKSEVPADLKEENTSKETPEKTEEESADNSPEPKEEKKGTKKKV